jgi:tetratricopeptide (TPR) repeat protein
LSLVVHLCLFGGLVYFFKQRSVLCFAIAFYLFNLLMVNNLLFDIGATMGERLIFHASVGFAIAVAWLMVKGMEKIKQPKPGIAVLGGFMVLMIGLCGFKTIERNNDWKNDETLFFHDVNVSPNSFLVSENVGAMLINKSDFEKDEKKRIGELRRGVRLFTKVIGMQENYVLGYMNRSAAYFKLGMADSMMADLDRVNTLYPRYPSLPNMYYHAGMLYLSDKQYERAAAALTACLKLYPGDKDAQKALDEVRSAMKTPGP